MALRGWPFDNYAVNLRFPNAQGTGNTRTAISVPRLKYQYIAEFVLNEEINANDTFITDILQFIKNGRIYASLKSIDVPTYSIETKTLNSYNKKIKIPTKLEYKPGTMVFHDDSSSISMALWKEYLNFHHHVGNVGSRLVGNTSLSTSLVGDTFQLGAKLVGEDQRLDMNTRPSMGMKLRPDSMRNFFEAIIIYDLGSEPDSINVYYHHKPSIVDMDQDGLDYEDRTTKKSVTFTFETEGAYFLTGIARARARQTIENVLDVVEEAASITPSNGHARMRTASETSCKPVGSSTNKPNPIFGDSISGRETTIRDADEFAGLTGGIGLGNAAPIPPVFFGGELAAPTENPLNVQDRIDGIDRNLDLLYTMAREPNAPAFVTKEIDQLELDRAIQVEKLDTLRRNIPTGSSPTTEPATNSALTRTITTLGGTTPQTTSVITNTPDVLTQQTVAANTERGITRVTQNLTQGAALVAEAAELETQRNRGTITDAAYSTRRAKIDLDLAGLQSDLDELGKDAMGAFELADRLVIR